MRNIQKGQEPESLTSYRTCRDRGHDGYVDYEDYRSKHGDDLLESLIREQRGLCCYCMKRITQESATVEHWYPQSKYKEDREKNGKNNNPRMLIDLTDHGDLDYCNLLAVCDGNKKHQREHHHCDASRGNVPLDFNPANRNHNVESRTQFTNSGKIHPRGERNPKPGTESEFYKQLDIYLNLNYPRLKNQRKSILDTICKKIHPHLGTAQGREILTRELKKWNGDSAGDLRPFCQVVVYWIKKRLGIII